MDELLAWLDAAHRSVSRPALSWMSLLHVLLLSSTVDGNDDETNEDPEYEYRLDEAEKEEDEEDDEECRDDKAVRVTSQCHPSFPLLLAFG